MSRFGDFVKNNRSGSSPENFEKVRNNAAQSFQRAPGEFMAIGRDAVNDIRGTMHEVFFGAPEKAAGFGTPLQLTPQEITESLRGEGTVNRHTDKIEPVKPREQDQRDWKLEGVYSANAKTEREVTPDKGQEMQRGKGSISEVFVPDVPEIESPEQAPDVQAEIEHYRGMER